MSESKKVNQYIFHYKYISYSNCEEGCEDNGSPCHRDSHNLKQISQGKIGLYIPMLSLPQSEVLEVIRRKLSCREYENSLLIFGLQQRDHDLDDDREGYDIVLDELK
jgi:hypothetical protein